MYEIFNKELKNKTLRRNPKRFIFMLNQVSIQRHLFLYNSHQSIRCNQNKFHHQFLQVTQNF